MKLYFAKYLQIEGIPTFGDKYKHPLSDDIFTNTNNTSVDIDYSECKKVKLFLCSRDIQVGDKVICPATGNEYTVGNGGYKNNKVTLPYAKGTKHFKVIGEISPEAVWVKEGEEFDEKDIQFQVSGNVPFEGWVTVSLEEYTKTGYLYERIRIKCLTCEHFH